MTPAEKFTIIIAIVSMMLFAIHVFHNRIDNISNALHEHILKQHKEAQQ